MKKIGLLGGSFDPVHIIHIALARTAMKALELDEIQLIPAARPWQRLHKLQASFQQRLDMVNLAISKEISMISNPIEIYLNGPTYTINTLKALPKTAFYTLLIGSDQLVNFCSWHNWQEIIKYTKIAVAQRADISIIIPNDLNHFLITHKKSLQDIPFIFSRISSSNIRKRIASLETTKGYLDPLVEEYIKTNNLYINPSYLIS